MIFEVINGDVVFIFCSWVTHTGGSQLPCHEDTNSMKGPQGEEPSHLSETSDSYERAILSVDLPSPVKTSDEECQYLDHNLGRDQESEPLS